MRSHVGSRSVALLGALIAAACALALALAGPERALAQGQAPPTCLDPGADAFGGPGLDLDERWTSTLRPDPSLYTIADGKARVQTGPHEIQLNAGGDAAPNIFLQPAPEGTWEITTRVKIAQTHAGQQAGLLLSDPTGNDIVKLTYVQKTDGENGNKWIEFLKIVDGQYDFSGTWHSPESPDYPDEIMLRYRSDGDTLSGWYSVDDGATWLPAGDSRDYEAIDDPQIGFYALRGNPDNPAVTAEFDSFNLVPANDEFDGTAVDECRWEIRARNDAGLSVGNGELTLRTLQGELSNNESGVQNLLLQNTNDSDWQATTKLTMTPTAEGQQAGLVIWGDNTDPAQANYVKLVFVRKNGDPSNNAWIEFLKTTNGVTDIDFNNMPRWNSGLGDYGPTVYLRLVSAGGQLSAYWSEDGEDFTKVGATHATTGIENPQVGLMALKGNDANKPEVDARFDWFRIEPGEEEPPPTEAPDCATQADPETGFTTIFDGSQAQFDEWDHAGQGFFTLNPDGSMTSGNTAAEPNYGLHWFTGQQYENFSLRMQWKTSDATDNSGVFVRFPDPGNDPNVAVNQGHEIQINENPGGDPQKTGSIYNADREDFRTAKPSGEWNDYEITVVGQRYTVCLNGKVVNDYTSDKGRPLAGHIGLQNHDPQSNVSFRNVRVKELPDAPPVQNIFDTIGITNAENRANAEINGNPLPYAFIAEQMPPSRSVGITEEDAADAFPDVPVRMPDTRGVVPNFASFNGQEYFLTEAQRKAYTKIHFFGTATDAGGTPSGGEFTLTFADGTTEKILVRFRDWANTGGTAEDHPAIQTNPRYTTQGTQGNIDFYIFHKPMQISAANAGKVLTSIKLPPNSTPGNAVTRAYLMALTFEEAGGGFEMPVLAGNAEFPNDLTPPTTTAAAAPGEPDGANGWYTGPVGVSLTAADETGGSQVEMVEYRVDGGAWLPYDGTPVQVDTDGDHTLQYRSLDRAGNVETPKSLAIRIDGTAPEVESEMAPALADGQEWYDAPAELALDAFDGNGSGVDTIEYSVGGGAWQPYTGPLAFEEDGTHEVAYRVLDAAGNAAESAAPLTVRIDQAAPATQVLLDGAAPLGTYGQPVAVELRSADGTGSGVAATEYRLDDGDWTPYAAAFTVAELGTHRLEFRSVDAAGNVEATGQVAFTRVQGPPSTGGQGTPPAPPGGDQPAPTPGPWAALGEVRRAHATVAALRRGRMQVTISCQSVGDGTVTLRVSKRTAKRLGIKGRTLARDSVSCKGARATAKLSASKAVKRRLAKKGRGAIEATLVLRFPGAGNAASDSMPVTLRR